MDISNFQNIDEFWKFTDHAKVQADYEYDRNMGRLSSISYADLAGVFLQYRFFTKSFASDLGHLVYRLPYGRLKSFMARILSEELGDGDHHRSHLVVYDRFLQSMLFWNDKTDFDKLEHPFVNRLMTELQEDLFLKSVAYGIGLRGMAGECLCQVYLTLMVKNVKKNPEMQRRMGSIDWRFWDIHAGEEDIEHRILTRQAIREFVEETPESLNDLEAGYKKGKEIFDRFWAFLYEGTNSTLLMDAKSLHQDYASH